MLGKLLKYELRATGRTFWPLFLGILIFGLINRFFVMGYSDSPGLTYNILEGISMFIYGALITGASVAIIIVIIQRFYRNLLGTEGYLMFTLPVKPGQLIFSKVLASFIWYIIVGIVVCISLVLILGESYMISDFIYAINEEFPFWAENIRMEYGIPWGLWLAENALSSVITSFSCFLLIYAAISIGHLSAKAKKLSAFGAFLLLTALIIVVAVITYNVTALDDIIASFIGYGFAPIVEPVSYGLLFHYMTLWITAIFAAFGTLSYFLIRWVFAKKLNIE